MHTFVELPLILVPRNRRPSLARPQFETITKTDYNRKEKLHIGFYSGKLICRWRNDDDDVKHSTATFMDIMYSLSVQWVRVLCCVLCNQFSFESTGKMGYI